MTSLCVKKTNPMVRDGRSNQGREVAPHFGRQLSTLVRIADYSIKCSHFVERRVSSWLSKQTVTSSLESLVNDGGEGGIVTPVGEWEVRDW